MNGDFAKALEDRAAELTRRAEEAAQEGFREFAREVILQTPQRTGLARGNWRSGHGDPPGGTVERLGAPAALAEMEAAAEAPLAGRKLHLANNLIYIRDLEYGCSSQAPAGMVRINLERFRQAVLRAWQKGGGR
ncbi:MAG: hypothetical protein KQJ78_08715 [Deltaproteobacteria bacterium]|nr:hypothetical protein [Deltaproteobacteria bacterium]